MEQWNQCLSLTNLVKEIGRVWRSLSGTEFFRIFQNNVVIILLSKNTPFSTRFYILLTEIAAAEHDVSPRFTRSAPSFNSKYILSEGIYVITSIHNSYTEVRKLGLE